VGGAELRQFRGRALGDRFAKTRGEDRQHRAAARVVAELEAIGGTWSSSILPIIEGSSGCRSG
jgi:hypothetical protein